jgi:hypothetical protein
MSLIKILMSMFFVRISRESEKLSVTEIGACTAHSGAVQVALNVCKLHVWYLWASTCLTLCDIGKQKTFHGSLAEPSSW